MDLGSAAVRIEQFESGGLTPGDEKVELRKLACHATTGYGLLTGNQPPLKRAVLGMEDGGARYSG